LRRDYYFNDVRILISFLKNPKAHAGKLLARFTRDSTAAKKTQF
jgi:hypothetical protein